MKFLHTATESIAFQSDAFFRALTLLIQDHRETGENGEDAMNKFMVRLDKCIYDHKGIKTNTRLWVGSDNAFIVIPALTRGNVLNSREFNKFLEKNFDADKMSIHDLQKKGWIDPSEARVGGAFSEVLFRMFIGSDILYGARFTPGEAATAILHEVGHAYSFLQFLADTVIVSGVLQRTWQQLTNANADKKVKIILTKAAEDMGIETTDWLQPISNETDPEVAYRVLVGAVAIESREMDNKRFFTLDSFEELADIFAIRHGAARELVSLRSKLRFDAKQNYGILSSTGLAILGALALPTIPLAGGFLILIAALAGVGGVAEAASARDITTFKHTAAKARNQMVDQLKQINVDPDDIKAAIENITAIDEYIQKASPELDQPLLVKFIDMFRRGKMDARASREYTDRLEQIVSNDLFIRAAQFGTK